MPKSEVINYMKKIIMKGILHIFWIYPVNKKKIFLLNELSYTYGDSLKYIDQYLHTCEEHNYEVVFSVKEGYEGFLTLEPHLASFQAVTAAQGNG